MEIRALKIDDLDECIPLFIGEWSKFPYNEKWTNETARLRLSEILQNSHETSLCVLDENKIIGFAFCRLVSWYDGKHGTIEEMIIDSRHQNQGIGTKLLNSLEENFRKLGAVEIELLSFRSAHAFNFFNKHGFNESEWRYLVKALNA